MRGIRDCTGLPVPGKREHNADGLSRFEKDDAKKDIAAKDFAAKDIAEKDSAMSPLVTALLCFGAFVVLGFIVKIAIAMWMKRQ